MHVLLEKRKKSLIIKKSKEFKLLTCEIRAVSELYSLNIVYN